MPASGSKRQVDGGKPQRRGVEHRAAGGDPRTVSDRRAEEAQDADRRVRLLELGEPLLPGAPRSRRAGGSAPSAGRGRARSPPPAAARPAPRAARPAPRGARTRCRSSGGTRSGDRGARARSRPRAKARMLVGRSGGRTKPSVNSDEPLISKARSKPLHAEGVEHRGERRQHHHHPHHRQQQQPDRSVQRHHRVAPVVGPCRSRERVEDHPESDERRPGHAREWPRVAARRCAGPSRTRGAPT